MFGRAVTFITALLVAAAALAPARGRAGSLSSELTLELPERTEGDLRVALASTNGAKASPMDFDLLGAPPPAQVPADDPALRTRRRMLNWHQGLGLGLYGIQLASTVTGQLNYSDKFGVANTGRYTDTHRGLVYLNVAAFATVGAIALIAPNEKNAPSRPYGRTTVHKAAMAAATIGMLTQAYLGIRTAEREGYVDKQSYGRAHLAVGYATLAAMSVGVGAIVF